MYFVFVILFLEQTPAMFVIVFGNIELGYFFSFFSLFCGNDKREGEFFKGNRRSDDLFVKKCTKIFIGFDIRFMYFYFL